jgi:hypothetical protein
VAVEVVRIAHGAMLCGNASHRESTARGLRLSHLLHSDAGTSSRGGALLAVKMMSTGDEEG